MRGVNDDWQVRDASNGGDGREVERVARVLREGSDAALAEDDVVVALGHYVLGGQKPLVEHRRQPALQEHGHARAPRAAQQREVLHVARADLYHVAVALDQVNAVLVQSFGHYLQAERLAYVCENLHAVFAESLEGVRGGARLERAAAEEARAASADGLRDLERLLAALDCARAGDDRHLVAADCGVADLHDGLVGLEVERDELPGLRHAYGLCDAGQVLERRHVNGPLVARDADCRARGARHRVWAQAQLGYDALDLRDVAFGGVGLHHDEHGKPLNS